MIYQIIAAVIAATVLYFLFKKSTKPGGNSRTPDLSFLPDTFIVFDLETTGLDPKQDSILEIGAIKVNRHSVNHDAFEQLINPGIKIPRKATDINGITQQMVEDHGKPIANVLPEFIEFIGNHHLVAFNAKFDMAFIREASKKQGLSVNNTHSCALVMARKAWPGLASYKLENLANAGKLDVTGNHRALKDCELATTVYMAAASKLKKK